MTLGERIFIVRKDNKMNQSEFAKELGITQAHISKLEKGTENPSETLLLFISYRFNVNITWLKDDIGAKEKYSSWSLSDNGLDSKYHTFAEKTTNLVNNVSGEDKKALVEAYCYFATILSAPKLEDKNKSNYLNAIHELIDELEKLQFEANTYNMLHNNSKNVNYKHLFTYINSLTEKKQNVIVALNKMINVYLELFNLPYRFK